jgi:TonB family protein
MQRELDRPRHPPRPAPPATLTGDAGLAAPAAGVAPMPPAALAVAGPALLIEARLGDLTLASRLLRADRAGRFTIGPGRRADAPVNPAWLPAAGENAPAYPLVERLEGGFFRVNLAPAMRAQLWMPHQRLPLPADAGRADAPLVLPDGARVRVACGEVTFDVQPAQPETPLPRPILPPGWRGELAIPAWVALALAAVLGMARLVPADPRALSLDTLGADHRWGRTVTIPLDVAAPIIDRLVHPAPGATGRAAAGPTGQAGSRRPPNREGRLTVADTHRVADARQAAARVQTSGLLAVLDGARAGALADVLRHEPALGADAREVLGHLQGTTIAGAYGTGSPGVVGTGAGAAGTGEGALGTGTLETTGGFVSGGGGIDYGRNVGRLGRRTARPPEILQGIASVRGTLDKEIVRRTVRRHLNEVRYCYEQALATHRDLQGRLVVQFTISPAGRVLAALLQSSTLGVASLDACVVGAVRRWEFPQPAGGGLVSVSYPFQLSPAGD